MNWPLSQDYNEAIQNPRLAFADVDLKQAEAVVGPQGLPLPRSGNFADVYQLRQSGGRDWAVKCFTRPVVGLGERYARVSEALARANFPFTVGFSFLSEGIRVGDAWRPVVKMDWVEGLLLNQVVRDNAGRPTVLAALLQMWVKLCKRLREAGIAHADLQHGNVLLVPGTRPGAYGLKLIDYDGMYVPALANQPSGETGHPCYQHPARASGRVYSIDVDRFPHLVVGTALQGLQVLGQTLWDRYDTGDNLLFTEADFQKPGESRLMNELWRTEHPAIQSLVGRLALSSGKPLPQTPWLDQVVAGPEPAPLSNEERQAAAMALGIAPPVVVPGALIPQTLPTAGQLPAEAAGAPLRFDLDEASAPPVRTGPTRRPVFARPVFLVGALVLLALGAVAAIMLSGQQRKPGDVAAGGASEPPDTGSTDSKAIVQTPEVEGTEKGAKRGSNTKPPVKPDDPQWPIPREPVGKLRVKERWKFDLGEDIAPARLVCSSDSRVVAAVGGNKLSSVAIDLLTGKPVPGSTTRVISPSRPPMPLTDGRFAIDQGRPKAPVLVWDARGGRMAGTLQENAPPGEVPTRAFVSPSGEYIALAGEGPNEPSPLRVKQVSTDKMIFQVNAVQARVFFTADSSRALVAEPTGRCRWFKIPSGARDGEWDFAAQGRAPRDLGLSAMSGDGLLLLFDGHLGNDPESYHLIDGRTGARLRAFPGPYLMGRGTLSADGRLFAAPKFDLVRKYAVADVIDTVTGTIVAELSAPPENDYLFPAFIPDRGGVVAVVMPKLGSVQSVVCFDLRPEGAKPRIAPGSENGSTWTVQVPQARGIGRVFAAPTDDLVLVSASGGGFAALEFATGISRDGFTPLAAQPVAEFVRMDGGRVGTIAASMDEVQVWDGATGKVIRTIPVPAIPPGAGNARFVRAWLSPSGRHLVVGRSGPPATDNPAVPLQVFETSTNRLLFSTTWRGGSVHFTGDSSRMLVAEWPGHCRWFKIQSGEVDGEWDLGTPPGGRRHAVYGISADGSLIAYNGPAGLKDGTQSPAILDGKTGQVMRHFRNHFPVSDLSLSDDGQRVALWREISVDACVIEVLEVPTGQTLKRLEVGSGRQLPSFLLSADGEMLLVYNPAEKKLHAYRIAAKSKTP